MHQDSGSVVGLVGALLAADRYFGNVYLGVGSGYASLQGTVISAAAIAVLVLACWAMGSVKRGRLLREQGLRERAVLLEVERDQFLRALPATAQFGTVLDEVRRNVSAAGAELTTFTVQSGAGTDLPGGVRPISLNLGVSGQFAEVFRALRSLETMNRFTNVGGLGLQLPQATSFNPVLEGTLNLTVYTFDPEQAAAGTGTEAAPAAARGAFGQRTDGEEPASGNRADRRAAGKKK